MRTGNKINKALIEARKMIDMPIRLKPDVLYVTPQYYGEYLAKLLVSDLESRTAIKKEKKHEVREVQLTFDL